MKLNLNKGGLRLWILLSLTWILFCIWRGPVYFYLENKKIKQATAYLEEEEAQFLKRHGKEDPINFMLREERLASKRIKQGDLDPIHTIRKDFYKEQVEKLNANNIQLISLYHDHWRSPNWIYFSLFPPFLVLLITLAIRWAIKGLSD